MRIVIVRPLGHFNQMLRMSYSCSYDGGICNIFFSDKTIIVWSLLRDETNYGIPKRALKGHNHFVSDVVISSDGQFALSGSWDSTLRLWELSTG